MKQIKIFLDLDNFSLEKAVNEFLADHSEWEWYKLHAFPLKDGDLELICIIIEYIALEGGE